MCGRVNETNILKEINELNIINYLFNILLFVLCTVAV